MCPPASKCSTYASCVDFAAFGRIPFTCSLGISGNRNPGEYRFVLRRLHKVSHLTSHVNRKVHCVRRYDKFMVWMLAEIPRWVINGDHLALTEPRGHRNCNPVFVSFFYFQEQRTQPLQVGTKLIGWIDSRNKRKEVLTGQRRALALIQLIQQRKRMRHILVGHGTQLGQQLFDFSHWLLVSSERRRLA
jgi:hypothetical protein